MVHEFVVFPFVNADIEYVWNAFYLHKALCLQFTPSLPLACALSSPCLALQEDFEGIIQWGVGDFSEGEIIWRE